MQLIDRLAQVTDRCSGIQVEFEMRVDSSAAFRASKWIVHHVSPRMLGSSVKLLIS